MMMMMIMMTVLMIMMMTTLLLPVPVAVVPVVAAVEGNTWHLSVRSAKALRPAVSQKIIP